MRWQRTCRSPRRVSMSGVAAEIDLLRWRRSIRSRANSLISWLEERHTRGYFSGSRARMLRVLPRDVTIADARN